MTPPSSPPKTSRDGEPAFRPIQVGDRYEDRDKREWLDGAPRIVEVVNPPSAYGTNDYVRVRVVAAPNKPYTVGRENTMRTHTLVRRYLPSKVEVPEQAPEVDEFGCHCGHAEDLHFDGLGECEVCECDRFSQEVPNA